MNTYIKDKLKHILNFLGILVILIILGYACPFQYFLGISCPGCGMTRAWMSALQLNFHQAMYFHPLFLLVPFMGIAMVFPEKFPPKLIKYFWAVIISIFIIVYIYRLFSPNIDIIYIDLNKGIVITYLKKILNLRR